MTAAPGATPTPGPRPAEVVPTTQRGALPGLLAPYLTGRLLDAADAPGTGYRTAFLVAALVMTVAGALAALAIRPEHDARRLGLAGEPAAAGPGAGVGSEAQPGTRPGPQSKRRP